jgi:hypothetical protein
MPLYYCCMIKLEKTHMPTKAVKDTVKIRGCDVMHLRESGQIAFIKKGNSFWYLRSDVEKLMKDKSE